MFYRVLYEYPSKYAIWLIIPTFDEVIVQSFLLMEDFKRVDDHWYKREDGTRATYTLDINGWVYPPAEDE